MIRSFRNRATEQVWNGIATLQFPPDIQDRAREKMRLLDGAADLRDLRSPGHHLERLTGDRAGQWSIRINRQWRLCFYWQDGDAHRVELTDYH